MNTKKLDMVMELLYTFIISLDCAYIGQHSMKHAFKMSTFHCTQTTVVHKCTSVPLFKNMYGYLKIRKKYLDEKYKLISWWWEGTEFCDLMWDKWHANSKATWEKKTSISHLAENYNQDPLIKSKAGTVLSIYLKKNKKLIY